MDFLKSERVAARFQYLQQTGSTNTDLVTLVTANPADFPHLSVLVAGEQTAGRGRSGRVWVSPPEKSLAISVLVKPSGWSLTDYAWLPLVAGVAMRRAVAESLPASDVSLKWPNDVQVGGKKISGILSELLADGGGVVIGAGINLTLNRDELPIVESTSLALEGWNETSDDFLFAYLTHLKDLLSDFNRATDVVRNECRTIGLQVRAIFPDAREVIGLATGIDVGGRLLISVPGENQLLAVSAADIQHLRHN